MPGSSQAGHRLLNCALTLILLHTAISAQSAPEEMRETTLAKAEEDRKLPTQALKPDASDIHSHTSLAGTSSNSDHQEHTNGNESITSDPSQKTDIDAKRFLDRSRWREYLWTAFLNGFTPEEAKSYPKVSVEKKDAGSHDKRFMRGFRNDPDVARIVASADLLPVLPVDDKRFMHGFKRDDDLEEDKRFMRGFKRASVEDEVADKRFMRGFRADMSYPVEEIDDKQFIKEHSDHDAHGKRFMRGFKRDNMDNNKRFMRGFRNQDVDSMGQDKRFIIGLSRFSNPTDKRFIMGLNDYNKRFMYGLHTYDKRLTQSPEVKRFMHGFNKRVPSQINQDNKRFIVGLNGYDRRASNYMDIMTPENEVDDSTDKRFMRGFHDLSESIPDKRFMKGLGLYSKKLSMEDDNVDLIDSDNDGVVREARFMKGFNKKDTNSGPVLLDHRIEEVDEGSDKRFIKGLVKKSESGDFTGNEDKRFIKGLVKKSTNSVNPADKRFMKGFMKKDDGIDEDINNDKKFIKGFLKKSDTEKDKKFMKGFIKKNQEEADLDTISSKRFMKGFSLYSKKSNIAEETSEDKRFMKGFHNYVKKDNELTDDMMNDFNSNTNQEVSEKRFIKGLVKKENHENETVDKRFMRGFSKKNDENENKRFLKGFENFAKKDSVSNKRFMNGFKKRSAGTELQRKKRELRVNDENDTDILRKLLDEETGHRGSDYEVENNGEAWFDSPAYTDTLSNDKRFMKGFEHFAKRESIAGDYPETGTGYDSDQAISKRFIRGFLRYYDGGDEFYPKRYKYTKNQELSSDSTLPSHDKRFMRGFESSYKRSEDNDKVYGLDKRFIKGLELYSRSLPDKRFIYGLEKYGKRSSQSAYLDDKRFIKGLNSYYGNTGKRFVRGLENYAKRDDSLDFSDSFDKRLGGRYHQYVINNEQALLSPYGHVQDRLPHYSVYQPKRDLTKVATTSSSFSPGISSRRFMAWRDGELVFG